MKLICNSGKLKKYRDKTLKKKLAHRIKRQLKKKNKKARKPHRVLPETQVQKTLRKQLHEKRHKWSKERRKFIKEFYSSATLYHGEKSEIHITGTIGLEADLGQFLGYAEKLIDCESKNILINISKCNRVWPSAVMLFSSLRQWRQITSQFGVPLGLGSTSSDNISVNSYLAHCGFYDFVARSKADAPNDSIYSNDNIVKIRKETDTKDRFKREDEILDLMYRYSDLNEEEIEYFNDMALSEITTNVVEHGIAMPDGPWYTLAQYHKTTGIISICIADNGIGIKNTLITGPQKEQLAKTLNFEEINDGAFILKAIEPNVSGAYSASQKEGTWIKAHARGARRGHGLKRVTDILKKIGITLNILSQYGCVTFYPDGQKNVVTKKNRVFAGTLYHMAVPATGKKRKDHA